MVGIKWTGFCLIFSDHNLKDNKIKCIVSALTCVSVCTIYRFSFNNNNNHKLNAFDFKIIVLINLSLSLVFRFDCPAWLGLVIG